MLWTGKNVKKHVILHSTNASISNSKNNTQSSIKIKDFPQQWFNDTYQRIYVTKATNKGENKYFVPW